MSKTTEHLQTVLTGLLVRESQHGGSVPCSAIYAALCAQCGQISEEAFTGHLESVLDECPGLGLAWEDDRKTRLRLIPGVQWFVNSDAYRRVAQDPCERLARLFADVSTKALDHRIARPRVLVDSGAAPFLCLLHRNCHLKDNASEILTTNLFVAQAFCEPKLRLISGQCDLRTGALVNCTDKPARLEQYLSARQRRPDLTLMSCDAVLVAGGGAADREQGELALAIEDSREAQLKQAAFATTKLAVFILVRADDLARAAGAEATIYPISRLSSLQHRPQYAHRDVYFVSDLDDASEEQQQVLRLLADQHLRDNRIWFVSPVLNTCPP